MTRSFRKALGAAVLTLSVVDVAGAATLFQPLQVQTRAAGGRDEAKSRLLARPATTALQEVRVDPGAIDEKTLEFELFGRAVRVQRTKAETLPGGSTIWQGRIRPARNGSEPGATVQSVVLVRSGRQVTGTIRSDGRLYRLRPMGLNRHALVQLDESRMPSDHPAAYDRLPVIRMTNQAMSDVRARRNPVALRVLVVATDAAAKAYGSDMQPLAQLAVAESNQGYATSKVGIKLQLAGFETVAYAETGDMEQDLARLRGTADGHMDEIHARRDAVAADVVLLMLVNERSCGLASGIGSTPATAFGVMSWDCATGNYTFAHEIGHLQGARHNREADPSRRPYPHGHGYRYQPLRGSGWRTIMAYDCSGGCPRLNAWSSPEMTYQGISTGIPGQADNRRVLLETKAIMEAFR